MKPINVKYNWWIKLKDSSWIMCKDLKLERDNTLKAEQCECHFDNNLSKVLESESKSFVKIKVPRDNIIFYGLTKRN